jgi:hypothetical protein
MSNTVNLRPLRGWRGGAGRVGGGAGWGRQRGRGEGRPLAGALWRLARGARCERAGARGRPAGLWRAPLLELVHVEAHGRRDLHRLPAARLRGWRGTSGFKEHTPCTRPLPRPATRPAAAPRWLLPAACTLSRSIVVVLPLLSRPTTRMLTCGEVWRDATERACGQAHVRRGARRRGAERRGRAGRVRGARRGAVAAAAPAWPPCMARAFLPPRPRKSSSLWKMPIAPRCRVPRGRARARAHAAWAGGRRGRWRGRGRRA